MDSSDWFNDIPLIGQLPPESMAAKLREMGDHEEAAAIETDTDSAIPKTGLGMFLVREPKPWQYTSHTFGYISPNETNERYSHIQDAGSIEADKSLRNSRIKITLDQLRVASYPGTGVHRILFDFYAQNQLQDSVEHLHFNATYRSQESARAAIIGYPIFVGLNVGSEGVAFKCFTVNVKNDNDEALLSMMESDVLRAGLKLVTTAQPAIAPLSSLSVALTKTVAQRNRNVPVQDFYMGLDFSNIATRARLATGSYIAVQIPESNTETWNWKDWRYDSSGSITNILTRESLPYNYIVFSISKYEGN